MAENGRIVVDLSDWTTMGDVEAWQDAANTGRIAEINRMMAGVVKEWPYEGDPADAEAYRALTPPQWGRVAKEVRQAVADLFQSAFD